MAVAVAKGHAMQPFVRSLCQMVALRQEPLSLVDDASFLAFCSDLNPQAEIPCSKTLFDRLTAESVRAELLISCLAKDLPQDVTVDSWTSCSHKTYYSLTR
jgi:hypothetical protein